MSPRESIDPRDALRLQLAAIAGAEPTSSYFEIRFKRSPAGMGQDFIPVFEAERAAASAINRGQMVDTYIGVCPRVRQSGKADAIERAWCLWADIDDPAAVEAARSFRPLPSIVVRTGSGGAHLYWPLRDPISPAWVQRSNRRLAIALGADRGATDPARILRPAAGTLNHKHSPPRPVECVRLELDVFTLAEVIRGLPDDPCYLACHPRPPVSRAASDSKLLEGIVRTVREATTGNRNNALYWGACRVVEHELGVEAVEALRCAALDSGLVEHEIDGTLRSALEKAAA